MKKIRMVIAGSALILILLVLKYLGVGMTLPIEAEAEPSFEMKSLPQQQASNTVQKISSDDSKRKKNKSKPKEIKKKNSSVKKKKYTKEELYLLSHLVFGEAGSDTCSDENQIAVASVVLNRVNSKAFPNTIKGVIFQKGQYACTWDGNFKKIPNKRAIKNAKYVLEYGSQIPKKVVYQSQFKQGSGLWRKIQTHYFCY